VKTTHSWCPYGSSITVYFDPNMVGERPSKWVHYGGSPQQKAVLLSTKTSFAYLRDYESTVTAAYLKDQQTANSRARKLFIKKWPASLTSVDNILANTKTSMVLVLFNIS
jgi:hypothetical protein